MVNLPAKRDAEEIVNRCRTCGRVIPKRRKYHSRECRTQFAERLNLLTVTIRKIKGRYAALALSTGVMELMVMPWQGDHVSRFVGRFDDHVEWQRALFNFTIAINEQWHGLRRRLRSERMASRELMDLNRTDVWKKTHFDLDMGGTDLAMKRDVRRAMTALSIELEELRAGDFLSVIKKSFAVKAHQSHPDLAPGKEHEFMRYKKARDTLIDSFNEGGLNAVFAAGGDGAVRRNPMPWSFFFDGYAGRWHYPD